MQWVVRLILISPSSVVVVIVVAVVPPSSPLSLVTPLLAVPLPSRGAGVGAVQSASLLSSSASALDPVSGAVLASSFLDVYTQSIIYHTRVSPSSTTHRAAERHQTTAAENPHSSSSTDVEAPFLLLLSLYAVRGDSFLFPPYCVLYCVMPSWSVHCLYELYQYTHPGAPSIL